MHVYVYKKDNRMITNSNLYKCLTWVITYYSLIFYFTYEILDFQKIWKFAKEEVCRYGILKQKLILNIWKFSNEGG